MTHIIKTLNRWAILGDIAVLWPRTGDRVILIDAEDFPRVAMHTWGIVKNGSGVIGYVRTTEGDAHTKLHRFILGCGKLAGPVDHINNDPLDNRKCNLRVVTQQLNCMNRRKRENTKSPFIGVYPSGGKWIARINAGGRKITVGIFASEESAARARDAKAVELYGPYAKLNFPR